VVAYAIIGMPGQTMGEMVETVGYLMSRRVLIGPSIFYPVPGTALFDTCRQKGILPQCTSQYRSSAVPVETADFDRLDIVTLFRLVRAVNFIKGKMDAQILPEGINLRDLLALLREKAGIKDVPAMQAACSMPERPRRRGEACSWEELLFLLLSERTLFCLQKVAEGGISATRGVQSKKVLDHFLERLWMKPIRGSRVERQ
jgi:hypothetical protein